MNLPTPHDQLLRMVESKWTEPVEALSGPIRFRGKAVTSRVGQFLRRKSFAAVLRGTRYIKGRRAIETTHQQIFETIFKDTTVALAVKQIRFLRSDVAVVHVNGHRSGPTKELVQDALLTLVMTKEKDGWTIAAFQNTAVMSRQ